MTESIVKIEETNETIKGYDYSKHHGLRVVIINGKRFLDCSYYYMSIEDEDKCYVDLKGNTVLEDMVKGGHILHRIYRINNNKLERGGYIENKKNLAFGEKKLTTIEKKLVGFMTMQKFLAICVLVVTHNYITM